MAIIKNGKYKGQPYSNVPLSYLQWMVRISHTEKEEAKKELQRRGINFDVMQFSLSCIDFISLYYMDIYERTRKEKEGLAKWLSRVALEAIEKGRKTSGVYSYNDLVFIFNGDNSYLEQIDDNGYFACDDYYDEYVGLCPSPDEFGDR